MMLKYTCELCCRYMTGDEDDLPDWFRKDEKKYNSVPVIVNPVSRWDGGGGTCRQLSLHLFCNFSKKLVFS